MSLIKDLILGFDIIVGILFVFFILVGFLKGFRKNLRRFLSFFIPFLLLVIFLTPICKWLLAYDLSQHFNLGGFTSVKDAVTNFILENVYTKGITDPTNTEIYALAEAFAVGIVKFVVYILGIIVIFIIIAPIMRIVLWIIGKVTLGVKQKTLLISRLFGMIVGAARFAVFFIIIILPIYGFVSVISLAMEDFETVATTLNIDLDKSLNDLTESSLKVDLPTRFIENKNLLLSTPKPEVKTNIDFQSILSSITSKATNTVDELKSTTLLEMINTFQDEYHSSFVKTMIDLTKSKKTGLSIDCKYLGNLLSVKNEYGRLNFIEEYGNIRRIIPVVADKIEITDGEEGQKIPNFHFDSIKNEDIEMVCDVLKNVQLVKVIAPAGYEYVCYFLETSDTIDLESLHIDMEVVKAIDINKEMDTLIEIIGEVAKAATNLTINLKDPLSVLGDEHLSSSAAGIFNAITKLQVVEKIALPIASDELTKLLKGIDKVDTTDLLPLITPEALKTCIKDDSVKCVQIVQDAYLLGLFNFQNEDFKLDVSTEVNQGYIKDVIVKLFNISLIKGNEEKLLRTILSIDEIKQYVNADSLFDGNQIDWSQEPISIANIVIEGLKIVAEGGEIKPETFLDNKERSYHLIETIAESDLVRKIAVMFLDKVIDLGTEGENPVITTDLANSLNFDSLKQMTKTEFATQLKDIYDIVLGLRDINVLFAEDGAKIDLSNEEVVKELIVKTFNICLIKGNEEALLKVLLSVDEVKDYIDAEALLDGQNINWETEPESIANVIIAGIKIVNEGKFDMETFLNDKEKTYALIDAISGSDLIRKAGIMLLDNLFDSVTEGENAIIPTEVANALNFNTLNSLNKTEFSNEIKNLFEILNDLKEINVLFAEDGSSIDLSNETVMSDLINRAFSICLIKGNETTIFNYLLDNFGVNEMLTENGLAIDLTSVDWETEPANLSTVFTSIAQLGDLSNLDFAGLLEKDPVTGLRDTTQVDKISNVLDALTNSQIFSPLVFTLIDKTISGIDDSVSFDLNFTELDKELIKTNTWKVEINKTLDVYDIVNEDLLGKADLTDIKGETVVNIMTTASQSVIASKVLGTLLVKALGDEGFGILPKNGDGTYKYDFTKQSVLASEAQNIGDLVNLANTMTNLTSESLDDSASIDAFVEEFKKLDDNEIAKEVVGDLVKDYAGVDVDLTDVNFTNEANTFEEVMDLYQSDPDNFDLESNTELKEKVESSEIAKAILKALGLA